MGGKNFLACPSWLANNAPFWYSLRSVLEDQVRQTMNPRFGISVTLSSSYSNVVWLTDLFEVAFLMTMSYVFENSDSYVCGPTRFSEV